MPLAHKFVLHSLKTEKGSCHCHTSVPYTRLNLKKDQCHWHTSVPYTRLNLKKDQCHCHLSMSYTRLNLKKDQCHCHTRLFTSMPYSRLRARSHKHFFFDKNQLSQKLWQTMANYLRSHIATKCVKETMSKNLC